MKLKYENENTIGMILKHITILTLCHCICHSIKVYFKLEIFIKIHDQH